MGAELESMTLAAILARWPETAVVFHEFGMSCPGCSLSEFYGIDVAATIYRIDRNRLLRALQVRIAADTPSR